MPKLIFDCSIGWHKFEVPTDEVLVTIDRAILGRKPEIGKPIGRIACHFTCKHPDHGSKGLEIIKDINMATSSDLQTTGAKVIDFDSDWAQRTEISDRLEIPQKQGPLTKAEIEKWQANSQLTGIQELFHERVDYNA